MAKGTVIDKARCEDDRLLRILDLMAVHGLTAKEIGERLGMTRNAVIGAVNRIKTADCAYSKVLEGDVGFAYKRGGAVRPKNLAWEAFGA